VLPRFAAMSEKPHRDSICSVGAGLVAGYILRASVASPPTIRAVRVDGCSQVAGVGWLVGVELNAPLDTI